MKKASPVDRLRLRCFKAEKHHYELRGQVYMALAARAAAERQEFATFLELKASRDAYLDAGANIADFDSLERQYRIAEDKHQRATARMDLLSARVKECEEEAKMAYEAWGKLHDQWLPQSQEKIRKMAAEQ